MRPQENHKRQLVPVNRRLGLPTPRQPGTLVAALRAAARPVPLEPPQIDPDLTGLSALERSAETLRYSVGRVEFWVSPKGELRAWFRLNLLLSLLLAVPAVVVGPILTYCLWTVATWSQFLLATAVNILLTVLAAMGVVALLSAAFFVIQRLLR